MYRDDKLQLLHDLAQSLIKCGSLSLDISEATEIGIDPDHIILALSTRLAVAQEQLNRVRTMNVEPPEVPVRTDWAPQDLSFGIIA